MTKRVITTTKTTTWGKTKSGDIVDAHPPGCALGRSLMRRNGRAAPEFVDERGDLAPRQNPSFYVSPRRVVYRTELVDT